MTPAPVYECVCVYGNVSMCGLDTCVHLSVCRCADVCGGRVGGVWLRQISHPFPGERHDSALD